MTIIGKKTENVFEAIDELTGLLRREMDDDGRFDAWA